MVKKPIILAFFICALVSPALLQCGEIIDRILAVVNGHIILQSEVEEAVAYEAFAENRPLMAPSNEQRKEELDRLIDQELIREEVRKTNFQSATPAEIDAKIQEIRRAHSEVTDESSWVMALHRYGLSPSELRDNVTLDLNSWKEVDAHLRPSVAIDSRSIERYYRETLLPGLRRSGAQDVSLDEVSPKIKEILAQQQINDLLAAWLKSLRSESNIQIAFVPGVASGGGSN